jgi:hypothetical protein
MKQRRLKALMSSQAGRLAHRIVEENAAIMKMHFRRKTTTRESKFSSEEYRIYANAQRVMINLSMCS